jgi:Peptidase family S41
MRVFPGVVLIVGMVGWDNAGISCAEQAPTPALPPFSEVYGLVRSNLAGVGEAELNRAAVLGFLGQLRSQVTLATTNAAGSADVSAVPLLSKATVFDGAYGFLRIGRVAPGLANSVRSAYDQLRSTNKLKGLIVDLRFAIGQDYAAAAETADLFFKTEQPLLQWGDSTARSTSKANAIDLPLVLLVNSYTSGAAEALAAAVRQADNTVIIGSPTAGHAYLFKEFLLSDGQILRIATGSIAAGNGQRLADQGLLPDIRVAVNFDEEKAYFEDPFRAAPKPLAQLAKPGAHDVAANQSTNRSRRRLNEAELVRMQRDGIDFEAETPPSSAPQAPGQVIGDPALSRALDLLKGLALALKQR